MNDDQLILLVEDDTIDTMTMQRALRDAHIPNPLHTINNAERALNYLRDVANVRPAIILLDINLPRLSGTEFLGVIKKDDVLKYIPVIVLTTSIHEQDKFESFGHSAAGYMVKPPTYDQFVEMLKIVYSYWRYSELPDGSIA